MKPALIVHGGAWSIPAEFEAAHLAGVTCAIAEIFPQLQKGMTALDAVEAAVKILEKDPTFDAGRGAFLNARGEIELDAMIMDGSTLRFGAVAAVQNILHPVALARMIMESTEHCFLVGKGAQLFAQQMGIELLPVERLLTERELQFYEQIKNDPSFHCYQPFEPHPNGTVGAVAFDIYGHLAAATSTGGTPRKLPGRVGDSPIVGAGAYADDQLGAASATGWGESIMKVLMTKTACDLLADVSARDAAQTAIEILGQRVNGWGGIILIDRNGQYGFAHNTSKMAFAYMEESGEIVARIRC
ncbi:MAG: isoaspartyl peptidase/L-asparaginase [candidate division KSB1 bacterium]|nr:isoaspartyl peptidase/L-asparaginase [candidate division KSB1 bacterium]MDZ7334257.1 isoaspartyl peptidase/L-asparaginase [candidate division KSB1 bacterium]MDZ7356345.1 isoaspartyl peptidase/L-asparaginase [candidate division KSB1 bacterium]MDZ7375817.1 isoaspartyl peptidase/L-asparaginase [candidate division KSB1 bacterium]MDZ7401037.1 isoaspartyl peptidase/L-asparaginase [candidate division KSB1 bacterium]